MNFQATFSQAELTPSLVSASLLYQAQNIAPLASTLGGFYKTPAPQVYHNPLSQLVQQTLPMSQIKIPPTFIKHEQPILKPLDMSNPLLANQLLHSYRLAQMSQAHMIPNYVNGLNKTLPQDGSQPNVKMLSDLLEKYSTVKTAEPLAQSFTVAQSKPANIPGRPVFNGPAYDPFTRINKKRPRRKAVEIERTHKCPLKGCEKSYGSEASMLQHFRLKHPDYSQANPTSASSNPKKEGKELKSDHATESDRLENRDDSRANNE